jgi:glutathione S-transferase
MTIALHVFPVSPRAFKVLFAAHQMGVDYELKFINLFKGEQNAPEFRALNPSGRMPVMEDGDYVLWESNAIVNYLADRAGKLPADTKERLAIEKWQYFDSNHWDPACATFVFERLVKPAIGMGDANPAEIARGEQLMARNAPILDAELQKHRYIAGDTLTVADISLGSALIAADVAQYPLEQYRGIQRWHADLKSLPGWARAAELQRKYAP